jgi:hypothetical protein
MTSHDGSQWNYSAASERVAYYQAAIMILANSVDD